jgi:CRP-like cAMP-binding protein
MRFFFHRKIENGLEQIYQDKDVIVREGDKGSEMYIIKEGAAKVTKKTDKREITLTTLSRGDFFGEIALFERTRRSATVTVVGETRVIMLHPGTFLNRLRQDPTLVFEMFQKMSKRIRILTEELARITDRAELDSKDYKIISAETEFIK